MNTIVASRRDSEGAGQTMQHDLTNRGRRSVRLRGYDYTAPGAYFVTVCAQDRACVFGEVVDGVMCPNDAGQMVKTVWGELPVFYPGVAIDGFVVMPNHVHGIIILVGAAPRGRPVSGQARESGREPAHESMREPGQAQGPAPTGLSLADVVHRLKTMTTKRYADGVKQSGWPAFRGRLWQRNYYDQIIRDESELFRIRRYIDENPWRWASDDENPRRVVS